MMCGVNHLGSAQFMSFCSRRIEICVLGLYIYQSASICILNFSLERRVSQIVAIVYIMVLASILVFKNGQLVLNIL